jgi:hypothetical protein
MLVSEFGFDSSAPDLIQLLHIKLVLFLRQAELVLCPSALHEHAYVVHFFLIIILLRR